MTAWAHSVNVHKQRQSLRDHLLNTGEIAGSFATAFNAARAGRIVGLLHDAGKIDPAWQQRLLCLEAGAPAARVDHKTLGSLLVADAVPAAGPFAISGHHGGIPDRADCPRGTPDNLLSQAIHALMPEIGRELAVGRVVPAGWRSAETVEFGTRLLHSCLVDADYLDTAAHFAGDVAHITGDPDMADLFNRLTRERAAFLAHRPASPVDAHRDAVFEASIRGAEQARGLFRLSAPTGSGKTIAAAGFALRHAAVNGLRRVVVAVPFTTITEQNAAIYRSLLGKDVVLEHHSALEPEALAGRGIENWDAPFIVTTTVQLLESLFSNKPSKTRKLHRLVNSVIILDEVQALPEHLLPPILDGLRVLVEHFGVSVLLASATQPSFEVLKPWRDRGMAPRELVDDPGALFRDLRRVTYEWREGLAQRDIVHLAQSASSSLTVTNTTANSRQLAKDFSEILGSDNVAHLSTRMCRAHRQEVLSRVRADLAGGKSIHLVSTQLIEAGVDLDFPLVLRQEAPASSLIQAGGRANREGRSPAGRVVVFTSPDLSSLRAYETAVGLTRAHFLTNPDNLSEPAAVDAFYRQYYSAVQADANAKEIQADRRNLDFAAVARDFRLIEDDSTPVVVDWRGEVHQCLLEQLTEEVKAGHAVIPMALLRSLQAFTVSLPTALAKRPEYASLILEPVAGLRLWLGPYDPLTGIGQAEPNAFIF